MTYPYAAVKTMASRDALDIQLEFEGFAMPQATVSPQGAASPTLTSPETHTSLRCRALQVTVINTPIPPLPARLWEQLVLAAGIPRDTRWATLTRAARHSLIQQLIRTEFEVAGKSLNKDEFVTCGGVRLGEVNLKTMESKVIKNVYFAGEVLNIDGETGGFNFQAAWTTAFIAASSIIKNSPAA